MFKDPVVLEYMNRNHDEFQQRMKEQGEILHKKQIAYENYMYYSKTPEEKAMNRTIWLNL